jgi:hypothetical protein
MSRVEPLEIRRLADDHVMADDSIDATEERTTTVKVGDER